jgi:DeoR/GlpR family transcriptional regulator of sugar metabolism
MAFLSGTTCKELVRELGRNTPITTNGLMDIITNFSASEEAVGAIFGGDQDKGKHKEEDPTGSSRSSKRNNGKKKKN